MAQFFKAKKILVVNHTTLHKIAEKIRKLEGNCVLINNTGRCGSTLLCQVHKKNSHSILTLKGPGGGTIMPPLE